MVAVLNLNESFKDCVSTTVKTLADGGVVCVPTDTVYGIVCRADSAASIERMKEIKHRPPDKPFALFVSSWFRIIEEAVKPSNSSEILAKRFWPGALTIVMQAEEKCPCANDGTVGVRCPDTPFLRLVMDSCGGVLVNTSMNRSGEPPVCSLAEIHEILNEVDVVIDAGLLPYRKPSTVVNCAIDPPNVLRAGEIPEAEIFRALDL